MELVLVGHDSDSAPCSKCKARPTPAQKTNFVHFKQGTAFCGPCAASSDPASLLQIRRSSRADAVDVSDLAKLLPTAGIQSFSINNRWVVFLRRRPSKSVQPLDSACLCCQRPLKKEQFCSLQCQVEHKAGKAAPRSGSAAITPPGTPQPRQLPPTSIAAPAAWQPATAFLPKAAEPQETSSASSESLLWAAPSRRSRSIKRARSASSSPSPSPSLEHSAFGPFTPTEARPEPCGLRSTSRRKLHSAPSPAPYACAPLAWC